MNSASIRGLTAGVRQQDRGTRDPPLCRADRGELVGPGAAVAYEGRCSAAVKRPGRTPSGDPDGPPATTARIGIHPGEAASLQAIEGSTHPMARYHPYLQPITARIGSRRYSLSTT